MDLRPALPALGYDVAVPFERFNRATRQDYVIITNENRNADDPCIGEAYAFWHDGTCPCMRSMIENAGDDVSAGIDDTIDDADDDGKDETYDIDAGDNSDFPDDNTSHRNHLPYGTIATRNAQPFRGYTSKPNPSMMSTGDANIDMHRFVSTQEAADEFTRRIRNEHESRQDDTQGADGDDSGSDGNSDYQTEFKRLLDESDEYYSNLRRDPIDD